MAPPAASFRSVVLQPFRESARICIICLRCATREMRERVGHAVKELNALEERVQVTEACCL